MTATGIFNDAGSQSQPQILGVVVALVSDNHDPQGQGRVKVRFPTLSDEDVGPWARVAVLMAGNQRGTFFLPEVGDEVLVAFEAGDITRAYILGGLWNGQDSPPDSNADGHNNLRLIKSRSGHQICLNDTDGSEKIEIVDKSGNNSIVFDTANNTVKITSAQDIELAAANGTIKLSAQNVSISSTADTKLEPQGELTLQATGNTTIKGAMVNIN